ncbi:MULTISPECIES: BREX-1 system phosphatase PglZ type B [Gammaproteobacteria]|uniref:BREX-1 system phosphatase PglZ type B n=1 Tax=Gammaproteobacteria TaxID=1236 RepID=UPI000F779BBD|nr:MULTISPECIES: BREX-1 system phosphatase PglZ type B [Gammaproteobacteria]QWZ55586.1 BREX-1 system phosphatase PglZ type B [Aeromonas sp. FDAARGOS 1402]RRY25936.1 BREX-1 system phosphatase PglZ type B [Pseudomonas aeruginosa]
MKLIDLLADEVRASAAYNSNIQVAPSVILWTDKQRQWESALPLLQSAMPELVVLGDYAPDKKQGPAIWIKCVIERVLPEFELPEDRTPIIYLPGLERRDLRAIAECPKALMPLAELQYRGCWWAYNSAGRDWTVTAFLSSANGGAGLDVARDENTLQAMLRVLPEVLESEREDLANRRLEAADFNKLISSDPVRDLLSWMNDSQAMQARWDRTRWQALLGICETEYHFSPERDGALTAAELLCQRQGVWESVWQRFVESSHYYRNLPQLLLKVEPDLAADGSSYPVINQAEESALEHELSQLLPLGSAEVRKQILALEKLHQVRRQWIWHTLGLSPLVGALEHLTHIARLTGTAFSGISMEEMGLQYRDRYWEADDHLLRALAYPLSPRQQELIQGLLAQMYTPWLDETTRTFQELVRQKGYAGTQLAKEATAEYQPTGELVFFVDGLRFDIARRLLQRLEHLGDVRLGHDWAALPSVTATAKAAVTPVNDRITGRADDKDFQPSLMENDTPFSSHYLKKFLAEKGWGYLSEGETGDPSTNAWVQSGDIDKEGHVRGLKLAARIDALLDEIVERIEELLAAGWRKIRIVTDHGWILTPEPMAKVDLPKHLTETRWSRCALLKQSVASGFLQVGWYWNPLVSVAMAPGARSFVAGRHYDHGGLSLQECLTPVIELESQQPVTTTSTVTASITDIRWLGLVCKVKAETNADTVVAVLRTLPADPDSEICTRKPLKDGKCSLMVDDQYEQTSAVLVLLDAQGNLLAKKPTLAGDE